MKVYCYLVSKGKILRRVSGQVKENELRYSGMQNKKVPVIFNPSPEWCLSTLDGKKVCFVDADNEIQIPLSLSLNEDIQNQILLARNYVVGSKDAENLFFMQKLGFLESFIQNLPVILAFVMTLAGVVFLSQGVTVTCKVT